MNPQVINLSIAAAVWLGIWLNHRAEHPKGKK